MNRISAALIKLIPGKRLAAVVVPVDLGLAPCIVVNAGDYNYARSPKQKNAAEPTQPEIHEARGRSWPEPCPRAGRPPSG
jgi:hypothetical protein